MEVKYSGVAFSSYRLQASKMDTQMSANMREVTVGLGLKFSVSFAVHSREIFPHL